MLYKPNFCAECGEKVERPTWGLLTSRRFCVVCETLHKGTDLIPAAIAVFGMLVFSLGATGLFRRAETAEQRKVPVRTIASTAVTEPQQPRNETRAAEKETRQDVTEKRTPDSSQPGTVTSRPMTLTGESQRQPSREQEIVRAESVYICGAETKKGTPCSRRVKGRGRCFQHKGMPAMMDESKLRVE